MTTRPGFQRDRGDRGAILILALIYVVAVSLVVIALASWASNDLSNTAKFTSATQLEASARNTAEVAINNIRYKPLLGANQTLNASIPSYCWGTSAPSSQTYTFQSGNAGNTQTYTFSAWCSTAWNPLSAVSRTVNIYVCQSTYSASACANSPFLSVVVAFDDYPTGTTSAPIQGICTVWCGEGMTIVSWDWSPGITTQQTNTITVTTSAPSNATVGGGLYIPAASASSGQSVLIASVTPTSCSLSSGVVQFVGIGTCELTFDDPGNVAFAPAQQVTQIFAITSANTSGLTIGSVIGTYGSPLVLSTSCTTGCSSTGAVSFTVISGTAKGCAVATTAGVSSLSATSAGTCIVTATKAADAAFPTAAVSAATTIAFAQAVLTVTPSSGTSVFGTVPATLTPTYSGFIKTDTVASLTTAPTCAAPVTATSPVNTYSSVCSGGVATNYSFQYNTAAYTITQATPTVFLSNIPTAAGVGLGTYTATFSVTTGDTGATSIVSSTTGVCTVSGNVVTFVTGGTCTLTPSVAASANYKAATGAAQSFSVAKPIPTTPQITNVPSSGVAGGTFTAVVSTSGDGVKSVVSSTTSVCTTSGLVVTYVFAGTCSLTATVAAGTAYGAASGSPQSFAITATVPGAPTNVNVTPSSKTSFTVTWSAASTGGASITSYVVESRAYPNGSFSIANCTNSLTLTCTISGLPVGSLYQFEVAAVNSVGTGAFVADQAGYPSLIGSLVAPTSLTSSRTFTFTVAATTSGNTLIAELGNTSGITVSTISSTGAGTGCGLTFTRAAASTSPTGATSDTEIWYAANVPSCSNEIVTVTYAAATALQYGAVEQWTGLSWGTTTPVLDGTPSTTSATIGNRGSSTFTTGSVTGGTATYSLVLGLATSTAALTATQTPAVIGSLAAGDAAVSVAIDSSPTYGIASYVVDSGNAVTGFTYPGQLNASYTAVAVAFNTN